MRTALRGVALLLAAAYAVSYFWTGWIDRLDPALQSVAWAALGVLIVLDVAVMSSKRFAAWVNRLLGPRP